LFEVVLKSDEITVTHTGGIYCIVTSPNIYSYHSPVLRRGLTGDRELIVKRWAEGLAEVEIVIIS